METLFITLMHEPITDIGSTKVHLWAPNISGFHAYGRTIEDAYKSGIPVLKETMIRRQKKYQNNMIFDDVYDVVLNVAHNCTVISVSLQPRVAQA